MQSIFAKLKCPDVRKQWVLGQIMKESSSVLSCQDVFIKNRIDRVFEKELLNYINMLGRQFGINSSYLASTLSSLVCTYSTALIVSTDKVPIC